MRSRKKKESLPKCVQTEDGEMICVFDIGGTFHWARYQQQDGVWLLMESERMPESVIGDYLAWAKQKFLVSTDAS